MNSQPGKLRYMILLDDVLLESDVIFGKWQWEQ